MHISVLNGSYGRQVILEGYLSVVWSERFTEMGDFEIVTPYTSYYENLLLPDTVLIHSETDEPMMVETVELLTDDEGAQTLKFTGRSLVLELETRVIDPHSGTGVRASSFVETIIRDAIINNPDVGHIPGLAMQNVATDTATDSYENIFGNIYEAVSGFLKSANVGSRVRLVKDATNPLLLELYSGVNRGILFSERNATLLKPSYLRSRVNYKNIAIVWYRTSDDQDAPLSNRRVYTDGADAGTSGLARRDLSVDASSLRHSDYSSDDAFFNSVDQLGYLALGKNKFVDAVDGEVPGYSEYKYRHDYFMGDLVSFQSGFRPKTLMRVTEYIWSIDSSGPLKSYPTFTRETT